MEFQLDPSAIGKPTGEPAMPQGVPTEPVLVNDRPGAILALAASPWAPLVAIGQHKQVLLYDTQRPAPRRASSPSPRATSASSSSPATATSCWPAAAGAGSRAASSSGT